MVCVLFIFSPTQTTEQAFQHILSIVDYGRNVMKPLLGEKYVHSGVSCFIIFMIKQMLLWLCCLITGCDLVCVWAEICFECPQEVVKLPLDFVRQLSLKIQQERPGRENGVYKTHFTLWGLESTRPIFLFVLFFYVVNFRPVSVCLYL